MTNLKSPALALLLSGISFSTLLHAGEASLRAEFLNPPDSSRPRTWWHWIDDKVTKDGITKDLEAMKRIGLKGAHITNIWQGGLPDGTAGDACVLTPHWLNLVEHAAKECERLGLQLGMSSASGCSGSGGPWITPELSMQELVWSTTHVEGGKLQTIGLPQPRTNHDYYRDIAVLAFPSIDGDDQPVLALKPKIASTVTGFDWSRALDGNLETSVELPPSKGGQKYSVVLEFPSPVPVRSLNIHFLERERDYVATLLVSDDNKTWRKLVTSRLWKAAVHPGEAEWIDAFPATTARFVRLDIEAPTNGIKLAEFNFQSARLARIHEKAARQRSNQATSNPSTQAFGEKDTIPSGQILDLTGDMIPGGVLQTTLPEGRWTILRFGHTTNGNKIKPVSERSEGLEVDKFSAEALQYHFDHGMLGKVRDRLGPLFGTVSRM